MHQCKETGRDPGSRRAPRGFASTAPPCGDASKHPPIPEVLLRPMSQRTLLIAAVLAVACSPDRPPAGEAATLVLRNGKIVTGDSARPEAQAIAVRGSTILAVGSNAEINRLVGDST